MSYRGLRLQLPPTGLAIVAHDVVGDGILAAAARYPRRLLRRHHRQRYVPMRKYEGFRNAVVPDHAKVESFVLCLQHLHRVEVSAVALPRVVVQVRR